MTTTVNADAVHQMLRDGQELALLDVREELLFSEGHLLHARSVPLSRLELRMARLVPRRSTRVVLCDADEGLAQRAADVLQRAGYTNVAMLEGGIRSWESSGRELFSGVNVPSKAFGEYVELHFGTPSVEPAELNEMLKKKADIVVVDSRPFDEFSRVSLPTAASVPGAELVLHARDIAPSPTTTIVVNCAGRTRSIIGAQSLINAGVPNKVLALRNGTMGWSLSGLPCESGQNRRRGCPSKDAVAWAQAAAKRVAHRFGVRYVEEDTLRSWRREQDSRTLYLFDVRDPREYVEGHLEGAISAPGGQLVQATDQYVGTMGARVVLVDDLEARAVMTASWLKQMGWRDVCVFAAQGKALDEPPVKLLARADWPDAEISPADLKALLHSDRALVVDLSLSRAYRAGHIPGSVFAIRSRLNRASSRVETSGRSLVLTSEDGILAALAVPEARTVFNVPVRYLSGGNGAWKAASFPLETGEGRLADDPVDVWLKPFERPVSTRQAMSEYLSWETDLIERIEQDGSCRFAFENRAE